jgi:hypothetical protein
MCENGKVRPVETAPGKVGGKIKENNGGVNSTKIWCKYFCNCLSVPTPNATVIWP